MSARGRLTDRFFDNLPAGRLEWIGVRSERKRPMTVLEEVIAIQGSGLEGDRRTAGRQGSARQVTLIQAEHLPIIGDLLNQPPPKPGELRRNLVVSGINLAALRHRQFTIGSALFEGAASCPPCSRMEEALGKGGFAAMLGHGGLCAKIIKGGVLRLGDSVRILDAGQESLPGL